MRTGLAGCLLTVAAIALASPAPALAEEHCPKLPGDSAAANWGINGQEQLDAGFGSDYENAPEPVAGLTGVTQMKVGFKFGLAVLSNCTLSSWGKNTKGQLGDGNLQTATHPVPVVGLSEVKEIAVGNAHAIALLYNGTVWTWGASEFGERGTGEKGWERTARQTEKGVFVARDTPTRVLSLSGVKQIAAGGARDYALLSDGKVEAWGEDKGGMLGVEEKGAEEEQCYGETHAITPVQCSTIPRYVKVSELGYLTGVERISAGEEDTYVIRSGGKEVLGWGVGSKGELGDGSTKDSTTPVRATFEPGSPVVEVAAGGLQALARLADGEVYAWGGNNSGQLGFEGGSEPTELCGAKHCSTVPEPITALNHIIALAAGEGLSLALKEEEGARNVLYAFGAGGHYELLGLGNPMLTSTSTPMPIESLSSVGAISASATTAAALLESGSGPTPSLALTAGQETLTANWSVAGETYKIRDRPVGTREFSKPIEGPCKAECSLQIKGLKPQPYEVTLKTPEGKEEAEKNRRVFGTPLPAVGAPVNLSPPTISGAPASETGKLRRGQTLTAAPGTWSNSPETYAYEWLRCIGNGEAGTGEELGTECEKVGSGPTYVVQPADVSQTLIVRVEGKNVTGWSIALSSPEVILEEGEEEEPPVPTPISAPTVSGVAVEGHTLTVSRGSWENSPTAYEDRWYRCKGRTREGIGATCTVVAAGASYVTTSADVEKYVEVQEKAENPGGYEVVASQAVQIAPPSVPTSLTAPTISGTVEIGQTLTEHEGTWTHAASGPTWQWLRCEEGGGGCVPIAGATAQTYTLTLEDQAHSIEVSETVLNGVGSSEPESSAPSATVPRPPASPPEATGAPSITGTVEQGATLTLHSATWTGEPKSYTYQWKRCEAGGGNCKSIAGATATTYVPVSGDVGGTLEVKETANNAAGSGIAVSATTAVVTGALPVSSAPPTVRGNARVGQTLSELHGSWSNEPTTYAYSWQRCNSSGAECEAIGGASARSYIPVSADVGHTLKVEEVAANATGPAASGALSAHTAVVTPGAPTLVQAPTVSGTGEEGQILTAHEGTWNGAVAHAYQWLRCKGVECRAIAGATEETLTLGAPENGYSVAVREVASNSGGWEAAISEAVAVGGPPIPYITSVAPATGPVEGGTVVTIKGGNLEHLITLDFGSTPASEVRSDTATTIKAVVPAGAIGTVNVTVTTPEGMSTVDSASHFTYGTPPSVTSISPSEGPDAGGTMVTITGADLEEATAVKFGASNAQSFGVQPGGTILAVAPPGSGTVGVTVTTPYGTSSVGAGDHYSWVRTGAPPSIAKLSMKKGPAMGGTTLTVSGSGFFEASAVDFGPGNAASILSVTNTAIVLTTPPSATGTVEVTVTTPFGTSSASSGDRFKYEKPTVTSVSPSSGMLAGGAVVTVTGTGFATPEGQTTIKFGKYAGTFVECASTTECTVLSPAGTRAGVVDVRVTVARKTSVKATADHYTYR